MKIKLTKKLSGKLVGNIGDVIEVDDHFAQAIIRQSAGVVVKDPPKPKEEKKEEKPTT